MKTKTVSDRIEDVRAALEGIPWDVALSAYVRKRKKRLVDELLLLQVWAAEISECLDAQRRLADANPKLSKLPHVSDGTLRDRLSRQPSNRFYNVQKAFSLPQDYRTFPCWPIPESWESQAILDCVMHPEKLPPDFLPELWFAIPDAKGSNATEYRNAVKAKIDAIPELKKIFAEAVPVAKTMSWRSRAFALRWTGDSPDGRIVAFQDSSTRESKRKNSLNTSVKIYGDAFAYLRSRYYAENFLAEREVSLKQSAMALSALIVRYDANPGDADSVESIKRALSSRKTFFEQRAYLDRLLSVELRNRSQDRLRIKWALSDVQKGFLERMGKRLAMESQAKSIEASIEAENAAWKSLYRRLSPLFENLDERPLDKLAAALQALDAYAVANADFPVKPFSSIRATFVSMRGSMALAKSEKNDEASVKSLKSLDHLVRSQAFWLFCFWLEHAFKTDSLVEWTAASEKLSTVVDRRIARIESMVFSGLDEVAAKSPRFEKYRSHIEAMRKLSDGSDYSGLVAMLENIRRGM